jgi:hypothetical protein
LARPKLHDETERTVDWMAGPCSLNAGRFSEHGPAILLCDRRRNMSGNGGVFFPAHPPRVDGRRDLAGAASRF